MGIEAKVMFNALGLDLSRNIFPGHLKFIPRRNP
jgi:hypothetical protein